MSIQCIPAKYESPVLRLVSILLMAPRRSELSELSELTSIDSKTFHRADPIPSAGYHLHLGLAFHQSSCNSRVAFELPRTKPLSEKYVN